MSNFSSLSVAYESTEMMFLDSYEYDATTTLPNDACKNILLYANTRKKICGVLVTP